MTIMPASLQTDLIRPYDRDALREQFRSAKPFPFIAVDDFLDPDFAREVVAAYPSFGEAAEHGRVFESVNEHLKLQLTDSSKFPEPVRRLHEALASPEFLADVVHITGIEGLLADPELNGGGIHQTGARGRLDVHVDFNYMQTTGWHRRLNILVYLNPDWQDEWGGALELWDPDVKTCHHTFLPTFNRCVLFETSEISYHGVTQVTCPADVVRRSFAAYYYTKEPPAGWDGTKHDTVFQARPNEKLKGYVQMPLEKLGHWTREKWQATKRAIKRLIGKS